MKYEDDAIIIMYLIMDRGPYQNAPGKVSHLQVIRTYNATYGKQYDYVR